MKLTDKMIEEIKKRINDKLKLELKQEYNITNFIHGSFLMIGIGSRNNYIAGNTLRNNKMKLISWISESTGLLWEDKYPFYKLVGGSYEV